MAPNGASATKAAGESVSKIPPGMILGPDGKPCKVCTAFRNWRPRSTTETEANEKGGYKSASSAMAALAFGSTSTPSSRPDVPPQNCPPDVEQLGRATWTFLHTTAAYYPERPTPIQRANMLSLIRSLPMLYPCTSCASDFGEDMEMHPPDVSGRVGLSRWLCERHNQVNEKLGKEKFDCSRTDERWKDGPSDGSCD
jgi:mitochondrial FAD-linked sulfhydryl oxidase